MALFEPLFAALNAAEVRYVVVGGVATVLHGHTRLTADVDLVIDLEPAECRRAIDVLAALGLQPRLPVDARSFADPAIRRSWIEEKGMMVFSFVDPDNPMRAVDLFAEAVLDFEELWAESVEIALRDTFVRVASIPHLIELRRRAGGPRTWRTSKSSRRSGVARRKGMADERRGGERAGSSWKAGWEDQEANALESSLAASPLQRLEWLEEAIALAWAARDRSRREPGPGRRGGGGRGS